MAEVEEDFSSLPLPDRFQHKVWKVRKAAYEDAAKQFETTPDEHAPVFRPFILDSGLWKGAVADSNVAAQQDGIAALCAFLKFGGKEHATRTRNATLASLCEKGLSSTRAATKESAREAILLYVELDQPGPVIEEVLPVLANKQPKVVAATLSILTAIIHSYGCKTVDPKPILKILPKVFGHADKNVRAEATALAVEFYRWLREAMKPMFWNDLKPTQQTEMETQFEKIKAEPQPKQERFLRSQQAAMLRAPAATAGPEAVDEIDEEPVEIDAFDLAEPQEVLSKVPADFHENLASSKWKERKEALEALYTAVNVPRIKDGDFGEIARGLAKSMKDANVAVVTQAAQCIEVLAKGLRKAFSKYRSIVMQPIMERMKEKKATIQEALGNAIDQVFASTNLTDCMEDIMEFLKHKNPQVKEGTMKFLIRSLKTTRDAPSKPEVTAICDAAKKLIVESTPVLRDGGAEIMGTVMKIMGERAMNPQLEGLDDAKKTKIKEYFDVAEVKAKDKPKPPPAAAAPPKAAAPSATRKVVTKKVVPKKPAPPPSIYAQPATAPLEPQATSRAPPSKLGGLKPPGGLKAPLKRVPAPATVLSSPRRTAVRTPSPEVVTPPRKTLSRGLAGRPLAKPAAPVQQLHSPEPQGPRVSPLDMAELEELRSDKDRLLRQCDDLRQEKSRLNAELAELKNENAQLIDDNTRNNLSIKAKETQLVRARGDADAAEQLCAQMRREMDRLKRALLIAERETGNSNREFTSPTKDRNAVSGSDEPIRSRDNGFYGASQNGTRTPGGMASSGRNMSFASQLSAEDKENGYDSASLSQKPSRSESLSRSRVDTMPRGAASPARDSVYRSDSRSSNRTDAGQRVESWTRASEVTSQLRARIEQMKAKNNVARTY